MFTLHSIAEACRVPGGLKSLEFADPNDLVVQPTWNIGSTTDLQFKPGKAAIYIKADPRTSSLAGNHDTANIAGDFFTYRVDARVRTIRATVESLRGKILNRRIHLVATYQDGVRRLVPYIRLNIDDNSGTRRNDKQGYSISGTTRLLMPGPDIAGNITTVPPPIGGGGGTDPVGGGVQIVTIPVTASTATYLLESGKWLVGWEVRSTSAQTVSLGLTAGGTELGGPVSLSALEAWVGQGNSMPTFDDANIYFSGLAGTNTIKLWILSA
jgi:hypothetical protein